LKALAEYLSLGPEDAHTAMWLRDAIARDQMPTIKDLNNPNKYFPYRFGQAFWAFVGEEWKRAALAGNRPVLDATRPVPTADVLVAGRKNGGGLNVSPAISPDGQWMMSPAPVKVAPSTSGCDQAKSGEPPARLEAWRRRPKPPRLPAARSACSACGKPWHGCYCSPLASFWGCIWCAAIPPSAPPPATR
jgi:hypothetical protein